MSRTLLPHQGNPDYVLDAIDDINTKADLLLACHARGLRVVSALGAGGKADPTRLLIGDITDPVKDPLAGKLRWMLRKRLFSDASGDDASSKKAGRWQRMLFDTEDRRQIERRQKGTNG